MNCPRCNNPNAVEVADEVDIGVGIQKFVTGCECPECGLLSCCPACGTCTDNHFLGCPED
jgi:hypothetical protein